MSYVDGFVLAVPAANKDKYTKQAAMFAEVMKELGATRVVECWADEVPDGKVTDFRRAVKAEEGEVVVFSWIEYPSKQVRDEANARMRDDERMKSADMPFDGKRMIYGGFAPLLEK
jgi:uncharacterized protein YbaA (DUF1428 family)